MNKTLLTKEEWGKAVGATYINDERSYRYALSQLEAQANKAYHIGKQEGFEMGIEQGKVFGIREMVEFAKAEGFFPLTHFYDYYMNEVGQREKKHMPNCNLCRWQAFLKARGVE